MAKGAKKAAARCGFSASAAGKNKRLMFRCSLWLAAYRKAISEKCLSPRSLREAGNTARPAANRQGRIFAAVQIGASLRQGALLLKPSE